MKNIILIVTMLGFVGAHAQYRIEVDMQAPKDSVYFLYHWYQSEKLYLVLDTAKVSEPNKIVFNGNKELKEGIYFLVGNKQRLFDFPVVVQNFKIKTDTTDYAGTISISGNDEVKDYAAFVRENVRLQREFRKSKSEIEKKRIYERFQDLSKRYISSHDNNFTSNYLKATQPVEMPILAINSSKKDTLDYLNYYYVHAFDNIELADDRLIRTPLLDGLLENYLKNIAYNNSPDKIIELAENLIARTKPESELRKYLVLKFGNEFISPTVLGCDKVYTELAKKYIVGEPESYAAETISKNREYINRIEPTLIGKTMPDMCLTDTLGNWSTLWDLKADYTMVVIYDYACGHCQDFAKKLVDHYPALEKEGMKVYMCCKVPDEENWKKFIKTYKTEAFTNVIDSKQLVDFDNTYNASLVPKVFLLDSNKQVLSNLRLEMNDFERMIKR